MPILQMQNGRPEKEVEYHPVLHTVEAVIHPASKTLFSYQTEAAVTLLRGLFLVQRLAAEWVVFQEEMLLGGWCENIRVTVTCPVAWASVCVIVSVHHVPRCSGLASMFVIQSHHQNLCSHCPLGLWVIACFPAGSLLPSSSCHLTTKTLDLHLSWI